MTRKTTTNRRPQTNKGRDTNLRVRQVQGLRFSNAAGPHISGARYDRNAERQALLSGRYDELED